MFWQILGGMSCAFYWGIASIWPLYDTDLFINVCPSRRLPFLPQSKTGALWEWLLGSGSPPWLRSFYPNSSDLSWNCQSVYFLPQPIWQWLRIHFLDMNFIQFFFLCVYVCSLTWHVFRPLTAKTTVWVNQLKFCH